MSPWSEFCNEKCLPLLVASQDDMYSYANRPRRTIAEVLTEFKSAVIPMEYIADLFPEIRPRQFSIASSSKVSSLNLRSNIEANRLRTAAELSVCGTTGGYSQIQDDSQAASERHRNVLDGTADTRPEASRWLHSRLNAITAQSLHACNTHRSRNRHSSLPRICTRTLSHISRSAYERRHR